MKSTVVVISNLTSIGDASQFLVNELAARGIAALVVNVGVAGKPTFQPDVALAAIVEAANAKLDVILELGDRQSTEILTSGLQKIIKELYEKQAFQGVISLGGTPETTIGINVMKLLPVGVPKIAVSSVTRPYLVTKDITLMHSVVDMTQLNRVSSQVLRSAAAAVAGMIESMTIGTSQKPLIALTRFGSTSLCVQEAKRLLESAGYEALVFHATGTGGMTMEEMIRERFFQGIVDITTTELTDELVGGIFSAGAERLEAAGDMGVPQVVVPGAIDMVNFGPRQTVPDRFTGRLFYQWHPMATLMRTSPVENARLGELFAAKLNRASGPVSAVIPLRGFSSLDRIGELFYDTYADTAFLVSLKANLSSQVNLVEVDNHINDKRFAEVAVETLLKYLPHAEK